MVTASGYVVVSIQLIILKAIIMKKSVSAGVIVICMVVYALMLQLLLSSANHAMGMDIATVVLSVPLIIMFIFLLIVVCSTEGTPETKKHRFESDYNEWETWEK